MFPLFESLCVKDGKVLNEQWHRLRFEKAYRYLFGHPPTFELLEGIALPSQYRHGTVKLRIHYNEKDRKLHFENYSPKNIQSLKVVTATSLDYSHKYSDRKKLNALFSQRNQCDDVLIVRQGWLTDSSYANVVLFDGDKWWTPQRPLLEGTCRARLLAAGAIQEAALQLADLKNFKGLKLINAMRGMDQPMISVNRLVY